MADVDNLVYQASATTGTGNFTLISTTGYRTFADAFPSSNSTARFYYSIRHQTANEYEIGEGYLSSGALVRHTVIQSSNSNNLVNFTSGTKDVINDIPANLQEQLVTLTADLAGKANSSHTHAISDVTGLQTALDGKVDENAPIAGATKTKITYDAKGLVTAGADATTADVADSTDKRYVTDAQLTVIGNTSGTNTGDQSLFKTISVSGQSDVVADSATDTLTLAAGSNITITTNASTDTITIAAASGASVAGSDTYVQFNDGGSFGGDADLTYNKTTNALTVGGLVHTPIVQAHTSSGLVLEAQGGSDVLLIGAGGGVNATAYGGWNFDGATANTIASFGASKTLSSLSTVTYPDLTELSYVKGVTSAVQTQLDAKASLSFTTISVSGQSDVVADSATDTLTLVAGSNVTITTNAGTDTITIAASGGSASPAGSDTQVQFNDGGSFGGDAGLVYNKTTDVLTAGGLNLSSETASRIAIFDASKNIKSGDTATYPDLTELSYVKGVTSSIQTQLGTKADSSFKTISVSGQSDVVADSATDTLTLVAGSNVTITTNATTDTITIAASSSGVSDGDKGDISVTSSGATWTIDNDVVTYAKMQNVSATNRILGRSTAGAGDVEEITVGGDLTQSGSTFTVVSASDTTAGKVELATTAETNTGTDATRAVTPDGLAGSYAGTKAASVYVVEANTALTTGDGKAYFRIPASLNGMDLVAVGAGVNTTSSSGAPNFMLSRGRQSNATSAHSYVDMLSTAITIDASEYDSKDATTPPVINTSNDDVLTGDLIRIDIDGIGTGTKGLIVTLEFRLP